MMIIITVQENVHKNGLYLQRFWLRSRVTEGKNSITPGKIEFSQKLFGIGKKSLAENWKFLEFKQFSKEKGRGAQFPSVSFFSRARGHEHPPPLLLLLLLL